MSCGNTGLRCRSLCPPEILQSVASTPGWKGVQIWWRRRPERCGQPTTAVRTPRPMRPMSHESPRRQPWLERFRTNEQKGATLVRMAWWGAPGARPEVDWCMLRSRPRRVEAGAPSRTSAGASSPRSPPTLFPMDHAVLKPDAPDGNKSRAREGRDKRGRSSAIRTNDPQTSAASAGNIVQLKKFSRSRVMTWVLRETQAASLALRAAKERPREQALACKAIMRHVIRCRNRNQELRPTGGEWHRGSPLLLHFARRPLCQASATRQEHGERSYGEQAHSRPTPAP